MPMISLHIKVSHNAPPDGGLGFPNDYNHLREHDCAPGKNGN
jgi:hypothetical protein